MLRKRFENDSISIGLTGFSYLTFDTMSARKLDSLPFSTHFDHFNEVEDGRENLTKKVEN